MKGLNKEADSIFERWIDTQVNDIEVKEFLKANRNSYYSFLAFFLKAIIHRGRNESKK